MAKAQPVSLNGPDGQRVDIQWMRALAVGMVLLYHFWPGLLPGGFVGVDIFLVISGFLITTHLLTKPPRSFGDVIVFWGRRVRRLLPAAFTVIIVTLAAVLLVAPMTQWQSNASSAIASGLYVQNWNLAWTSVDYLAATDPPSALQHYWSLSVEEQFYLVWPLLIAAAGFVAARGFATPGGVVGHAPIPVSKRTSALPATPPDTAHNPPTRGEQPLVGKDGRRFRVACGIAVFAVVAASLAWSVYFTPVNPEEAYFVTPTRMWELGAGGALAVGYPAIARRLAGLPAVKVALVALGCGLMVWSGFQLTGEGFPGWIALIPIVGAVLVIGAGPADYRFSFDRVLKLRPFQFLGDISYSVYLWHWPFVVLTPWALDRATTEWEKLATIAVVIGLSWASKTQIEDRFRGSRPLGVPLRRTFVFLVAGMLVITCSGVAISATIDRLSRPQNLPDPADLRCVGAAVRLDPACAGVDPHGDQLLMTPLQAATDRNVAYADGCWWSAAKPDDFPTCQYGSTDETAPQIALVGNSHAGPWLDPLIAIADDRGWGLRTHLASRCFPATRPLNFANPAARQGCLDFTTRAIADMKARDTRLVVMSVRTVSISFADAPAGSSEQAQQAMFGEILRQLTAAGMRVLVIRDVPYPPDNVTDCVAAHPDDLSACDSPRKKRMLADTLFDAASSSADDAVRAVDFTDAMCDEETCWDVVGGLIAYFNRGHLSSQFANTFRPYLEAEIDELIDF